jgi:hypothetical protein
MVSSKKKRAVMNPIRRRMKKRNPSSGQNGQLVHWWLLIHSGPWNTEEQMLTKSNQVGNELRRNNKSGFLRQQ